jgi:outer membrane protein OmpA-like peptidoglycan-associated protein
MKSPAAPATVSDEHWIPLSDLMSGLMMVFMLLAVLFMLEVEEKSQEANATAAKVTQQAQKLSQQAQEITALAEAQVQMKDVLYQELMREFASDLPQWRAEIDKDLTVRFNEPDVLFASGSADVSDRFKLILADFFPRYIRLLDGASIKNAITEIRLEGHTSSKWNGAVSVNEAYLNNMALSQARTRNVLAFLLEMGWGADTRGWIIRNLTANGLSSSQPVLDGLGAEDVARSQRVEFRVMTRGAATIATGE